MTHNQQFSDLPVCVHKNDTSNLSLDSTRDALEVINPYFLSM